MTKHFAVAFVAASALLAAISPGAFARSPSRAIHPMHHVRAAHRDRTARLQVAGTGDTSAWVGETGKASYYSQAYNGRRSASGVRFDQGMLTAAHAWLPFGTKVRVVLAGTDRSVVVTITDRIYSSRRVLDLSVAAARELGIIRRGVAKVTLTPA